MPEDQQPAPPDQQQAPGQQQRPVEPAPDDEAVQSRASGRTRGRHSPKGTQTVRTQPHPADNKSPQDLEQGARKRGPGFSRSSLGLVKGDGQLLEP
ncbi:MAG TPA: hypothetical protein VEY13_00770 [Rubrobacteraceae bacterium]|nr:hypothetical protein [Rubrobacteraceae bacterium]